MILIFLLMGPFTACVIGLLAYLCFFTQFWWITAAYAAFYFYTKGDEESGGWNR